MNTRVTHWTGRSSAASCLLTLTASGRKLPVVNVEFGLLVRKMALI